MKIKIKQRSTDKVRGVDRLFFDGIEVKGLISLALIQHTRTDDISCPELTITVSANDLEFEGADGGDED